MTLNPKRQDLTSLLIQHLTLAPAFRTTYLGVRLLKLSSNHFDMLLVSTLVSSVTTSFTLLRGDNFTYQRSSLSMNWL